MKQGEIMRFKLMLAAIASLLMVAGAQAQDGARAFFPLPAGTNDIDLTATFSQFETSTSVIDSAVFTPSYRHTFDLGGDAATFLIGLPVGTVSGTLFGVLDVNAPVAQGDLFVGGTVGLLNAPALTPMAYAQNPVGLSVSLSSKLFLPTGAYDSNNYVSLGQNRWSLQASLPITYTLGTSLIDPNLTTFEVVPSVQIFGDNPDSPIVHTVTSQAPLFGLEGHVSHTFNPAIWAALDAFAQVGGQTSTNGVANPDDQQSLALGATVGVVLSPAISLRLSYQEQVYSKTAGNDSRRFMATSAFLF